MQDERCSSWGCPLMAGTRPGDVPQGGLHGIERCQQECQLQKQLLPPSCVEMKPQPHRHLSPGGPWAEDPLSCAWSPGPQTLGGDKCMFLSRRFVVIRHTAQTTHTWGEPGVRAAQQPPQDLTAASLASRLRPSTAGTDSRFGDSRGPQGAGGREAGNLGSGRPIAPEGRPDTPSHLPTQGPGLSSLPRGVHAPNLVATSRHPQGDVSCLLSCLRWLGRWTQPLRPTHSPAICSHHPSGPSVLQGCSEPSVSPAPTAVTAAMPLRGRRARLRQGPARARRDVWAGLLGALCARGPDGVWGGWEEETWPRRKPLGPYLPPVGRSQYGAWVKEAGGGPLSRPRTC